MLIIKKRTVEFEVETRDWCDAYQWLLQIYNGRIVFAIAVAFR